MKAIVMRMIGVALLWAGLAALVYVPSSGDGPKVIVAVLGFLAFAAGLSLMADALKDQIVNELQRNTSGS